jgi:hypothetical protein
VDSVAAIDQAVADGVDVINFSLEGSLSSVVDPVELAFLTAADAGVFVATSAGNDGRQAPSTVQHNSPWVTTVGIATHDRQYEADVVFENGRRFTGASVDDTGRGERNIVLAGDAAETGQAPGLAALCLPGTLQRLLVVGKIVVCDRGENDRVEKSQVVRDSGGVGMVLVNPTPNTLNADIHAVPTVHLDHIAGAALKSFVRRNPAQRAELTPRRIITGSVVPAPNLATDSSRGPALAADGDLLKPDLIAPGVNILAASSPVETDLNFEFLSGSSMSSAFVAGIAAILEQVHPDWSPAAMKSALMTTATQRRNDGQRIREDEGTHPPADAFGMGAGLVQPTAALDPGLVYDANSTDWLQFICGTGEACFPPLEAIDPSDLNHPSIAIGDFVGQRIVRRTVTNVGQHNSRYVATVEAPPGFSVSVSPGAFNIAPGASQTFEVRFTRAGARLDRYAFGAITWSDGRHRVRSPIAILPKTLSAPGEVSSTGSPIEYSVRFGYSGTFKATARGLIPARTNRLVVADDPANDINTALATGRGIVIVTIPVAPGSTHARFSLFDSDTNGNDDLDLYVFSSSGDFVAASAGLTTSEEVNLVDPAPDEYLVVVHGFETDGPAAQFTLFSWALGSKVSGNMTVIAPAQAQVGRDGKIRLVFSKLTPGVRYFGSVAYSGATGVTHPTLVRVDR